MALHSGSLDRLTGAGVVISGAAADDMDVEVFVLLQAARAFKKEIADDYEKLPMTENEDIKEDFIASLKKLNVPTWIEFFEMAKDLTNVKIHVCSLAGKVWDGEKTEDFIDLVDDICGIGEYLDAAQEADVHLFI
ncbi:MAG: DsrE/DsrF/DrsH-like family protein [Bacteroidota bacterium]